MKQYWVKRVLNPRNIPEWAVIDRSVKGDYWEQMIAFFIVRSDARIFAKDKNWKVDYDLRRKFAKKQMKEADLEWEKHQCNGCHHFTKKFIYRHCTGAGIRWHLTAGREIKTKRKTPCWCYGRKEVK